MYTVGRGNPTFGRSLDSEASGGIVLMVVTAQAIATANSPLTGYTPILVR